MKRVAIVVGNASDPGGHNARLLLEASERFEVLAVASELAEPVREAVRWLHMPDWSRRVMAARWLVMARGANRALRGQPVDLVHELSPLPFMRGPVDVVTPYYSYTALYETLGGRPPGAPPTRWRANRAVLTALERWAYSPRRARVLAAMCEGQRLELERLFEGARVETVPRGTNVERFRPPGPGERQSLRAELGLPASETVAVLVARAERYKGLPLALEALAELRRRGRRPPLLVVSSRPDRRWAPRLAERLGVADRVRMIGWPPGIERWLRAGDLFVLPTAYETYCQAAHEAAATALPVVAPAVSGIDELIGADEAGLLVTRSAGPIADALARLEDDPALRARLGREGRARAEREDQSRFARETVELYERLLAEGAEAARGGS